jgi:hypothetical protein
MGKVRLTGAVSGFTEIIAPDTAGNNTLTLPASGAGQLIATSDTGVISASMMKTGAAGTGAGYVYDAGSNYIIWVAPSGSKVGMCWGEVTSNTSNFVTVTFPITFASSPSVTVTDHDKGTFSTASAFVFMLSGPATTTSFLAQCVSHTSTGVGNIVNRTGYYQATGPVG